MSLRNRVRNQRRIQESDEDEKYSFAYQRAFCEVVVHIHEQYTSNLSQSDKPVVFRLVEYVSSMKNDWFNLEFHMKMKHV